MRRFGFSKPITIPPRQQFLKKDFNRSFPETRGASCFIFSAVFALGLRYATKQGGYSIFGGIQ
jgi:hypothetical protein